MNIQRVLSACILIALSFCLSQITFAAKTTSGREIADLSSPELKPPSPGKLFKAIDLIATPRGEGLRVNIEIINDFLTEGIWSEHHQRAPGVRMLLSGNGTPESIKVVEYNRTHKNQTKTRTLVIQNTRDTDSSCTTTGSAEAAPSETNEEATLTLTIIVPFGFQIDARQFNLAEGYTVTDRRFSITYEGLLNDPLMRQLGGLTIEYWADMAQLEGKYWAKMEELRLAQDRRREAGNALEQFNNQMREAPRPGTPNEQANARNSRYFSDRLHHAWNLARQAEEEEQKMLEEARIELNYRQLEWYDLKTVLNHLSMGRGSFFADEGMEIPPTLEARLEREIGGEGVLGCTMM